MNREMGEGKMERDWIGGWEEENRRRGEGRIGKRERGIGEWIGGSDKGYEGRTDVEGDGGTKEGTGETDKEYEGTHSKNK